MAKNVKDHRSFNSDTELLFSPPSTFLITPEREVLHYFLLFLKQEKETKEPLGSVVKWQCSQSGVASDSPI